jgi:hypothetical protein
MGYEDPGDRHFPLTWLWVGQCLPGSEEIADYLLLVPVHKAIDYSWYIGAVMNPALLGWLALEEETRLVWSKTTLVVVSEVLVAERSWLSSCCELYTGTHLVECKVLQQGGFRRMREKYT